VGQFVDALRTNIISGLTYTGLHNAICEGDDIEVLDNIHAGLHNTICEGDNIELLDNLHSFLQESRASPPNPSTSHGRETLHDGLSGSHFAEQVQREENYVDMGFFSVVYVSGFIVRHVLCAVR
jgi:hypothetical protein